MANEKKTEFTVTDKRKFNLEGEPLSETGTEEQQPAPAPPAQPPASQPQASQPQASQPQAAPPDEHERQQQAERYQESSRNFDAQLQSVLDSQGESHRAADFEMNFEKFVASLYMTALLQLGLVHEQGGQPAADLIGARQTIDTMSIISEKTKGNLTTREEHMLNNCLYELRMAYIEVTNALTHPPVDGAPPDPSARLR